jgi:hypothetical protein
METVKVSKVVSLYACPRRMLAFNSLFFSLRLKLTTTAAAFTIASSTSYWSLHPSALSEQVRPPLSLSFSSLLSLCLPSTKTTTTTTTTTTVKTAVASRRQVVASEAKGALYRRNRMAVTTSLKRAARRPAAVVCLTDSICDLLLRLLLLYNTVQDLESVCHIQRHNPALEEAYHPTSF